MRRLSFFFLTAVLLSACLAIRSHLAVAAVGEPIVRDGWWIRINTNQTQATSIDFQIGTKAQDRETWRTWHSNDPIEFDVPAKYRSVERIYIRATANPEGRKAWFCLMYAGKGVKHFDTDNWQQEDRSQNDNDDDCK
jgi:hypothetical protein